MVALLTSEELNVLVLLDSEKDAYATKDEIVKAKLIRDEGVIFVSEAFGNPVQVEADIEDLLDLATYEALISECYQKELSGKTLKLNPKIPRVAKRYKAAFSEAGIEFQKTRPARLMLKKMATNPVDVVPPATVQRFEALFDVINKRMAKQVARVLKPFA